MSALTVIKFYCDDEIKRIPMNRSLGELTYDELCVIVQRVWKSKLSTDINNLILKYVDDEGDQICLESDIDISHALTFSTCLKVHVYDKETIPVNSKSLISNLTLEKKSLESIKKIVKNSRDTLNKIIEQLDKVNVDTAEVEDKNEKELKPLSNAELSEFLGDQNDTNKNEAEDVTSTPAVVDQTVSTAPPAVEASTNSNVAAAPPVDQTQTQSSTQYQGSLVQTPNSIHPSQPPSSNFTQPATTSQLSQAPPSSSITSQTYASPTTTYPPQQSTQNNNTTTSSTISATGNQSSYQKTNSYSSNMSTQPVSQTSNTSTNMYASAPPPAYGSYATTNTKYGSTTASNTAPPPTSVPYPPSSNAPSTTNPSPYQRYPQTPTYATSNMSGASVPPPPQGGAYGTPQGMQNPYGYASSPYGTASSTAYGTNPYSNSYNSNQNTYSRPNNTYGQNKYY